MSVATLVLCDSVQLHVELRQLCAGATQQKPAKNPMTSLPIMQRPSTARPTSVRPDTQHVSSPVIVDRTALHSDTPVVCEDTRGSARRVSSLSALDGWYQEAGWLRALLLTKPPLCVCMCACTKCMTPQSLSGKEQNRKQQAVYCSLFLSTSVTRSGFRLAFDSWWEGHPGF